MAEAPPTGPNVDQTPEKPDQKQSQSQSQSQTQSQTQSTLSPSQVQPQSQSQSQSQGKSSSSSSGSSGTLSSMDTVPVTLPSVPEEPEPEPGPEPWGRLLPLQSGFTVLDCIKDSYVLGRDRTADHRLGNSKEEFRIYSKQHFRIYREGSEAFVEDLSNNGTFVDGRLVGIKRKLPLGNNATISLSYDKNRVFVFTDLSSETTVVPKALQEKYALGKTIGTGVCGEVKLALERETMKKYAVKIINKCNFKSEGTATRNAETEIQILQRIDHPCLMKTVDFYQTEESYFIVLELMEGGELFLRVKSKKQIPEDVAKFYFYQMLLAVQYLHSQGIIHRDLKPENVLLSNTEDYCLIKVSDFNQSRILEETALMKTLCGTPSYLAPEVFTAATTTEGYSLSVDVWSLGVLLFVCLGGYPPFHQQFGPGSVQEQILSGKYTLVQKQWNHISEQAVDLVKKLLVVDPKQRLNIEETLNHPWLQDDEMKQKVHKVMYPEPEEAPADPPEPSGEPSEERPEEPSSTTSETRSKTRSRSSRSKPGSSSSSQAESVSSSRKRSRSGNDDEKEKPKKRR